MSPSIPVLPFKHALTIATSDSGGGAGIQADLKTFAALGVYGASVVSAVTAQNTIAVTALESLSPSMVESQLKAVFDDFPIEAIKIGLLGNAANTRAVVKFLETLPQIPPIILDPVMVSTSGHVFLDADSVAALKELFFCATLITPNRQEAEVFANISIVTPEDFVRAAENILALGVKQVLIKGGHGEGALADDLWLGPFGPVWYSDTRISTHNDHGTGCTLSSAIAAFLARGLEMGEALKQAKEYVTLGLRHSLNLGHGPGPLNHFHRFYLFENN